MAGPTHVLVSKQRHGYATPYDVYQIELRSIHEAQQPL